jgi:hypothetical protein
MATQAVKDILDTPRVVPKYVAASSPAVVPDEFSRSGIGYEWGSEGKIVQYGDGEPRHYYDPATGEYGGIALSGRPAFNDIPYSTAYSQIGSTVGVVQSVIEGKTANKMADVSGVAGQGPTFSARGRGNLWGLFESTGSGDSFQFLLKRTTNKNQQMGVEFDFDGPAISTRSLNTSDTPNDYGYRYLGTGPNGGDLYRVWFSYETSNMNDYASGDTVRVSFRNVSGNPIFHFNQHDQDVEISAPYVTGSSAGSMNAESFVLSDGGDNFASPYEGTFLIDFRFRQNPTGKIYFSLGGAAGLRDFGGFDARLGARDGSSNATINVLPEASKTPIKYALTFDENEMRVGINGQTSGTSHNGNFLTSEGSIDGRTGFVLRRVRYIPRKLSDSHIKTLTV